ncbi:MAG: hypothetical protein ABI609_18730 [Acidobacteriota bacterium]
MRRLALRSVLLSLSLFSPTLLLGTELAPCKPCGGLRGADPTAIAASFSTGWRPDSEAHFFIAWSVDLSSSMEGVGNQAANAAAVRAAGGTPWMTLVFHSAPPLREQAEWLNRELQLAVTAVRDLGAGAIVQVDWSPPEGVRAPAEYAFLLKRAAVAVGGAAPGARIATAAFSGDAEELNKLYAEDVAAYIDAVALKPQAQPSLAQALATLTDLDPGKPVVIDGEAYPTPADQALEIAGAQAAAGVAATLFTGDATSDVGPLKALAGEFHGDLSYDSTSSPEGSWAFVRGKDLALRVVAHAGALRFPDPTLTRVERVDFASGKIVPLGGRRVGQTVEVNAATPGVAFNILRLERTAPEGADQVKEAVTVADTSGPSVEEILRRLQEFEDGQARRLDHYQALNSTSLRFRVGEGLQSIEATFQGPYFFHQGENADWVWKTFFVNGVRWRGKSIPELPLIQPERAASMPLEVHFTKEYRYSLRGSETVGDRDCWVVDFAPGPEAKPGASLYRGSVWVDKKIFSRVRTKALQLGLTGDVLSNEETMTYSPIDANGQSVAWSSDSFVLPLTMVAQQILSILNATTLVERETHIDQVQINDQGYDSAKKDAFASDATIVRDTAKGLRYMKKTGAGERVEQNGFAKSKLFAIGGVFYEKSLDYPLPLAGINYFSLDLKKTGQQFNVFFAGALATVSLAQPRLFGSRLDLGGSLFAIAIPLEDKQYRNGGESAGETFKILPSNVGVNIGHPLGNYAKLGLSYDLLHVHYQREKTTAPDFVLPVDHFTHSLSGTAKFARSGYQVATAIGYNWRGKWDPWGLPANPDYSTQTRDYWRWNAALSKTWSFSKFRRFGAEVDYVGGRDLDRFSKYEFGYFGSSRVHGYRSNRVRAEEAYLAHLSYGFGIGDLFRIDAVADGAIANDKLAGLHDEFLAGAGISGTFMGPWQTIINLDFGVPVAGPEDGFTVYLVFLKLFH